MLFAGTGLALLQTVGVTGLAAQIADGFVEAVRQHGQLAAVTQGAGSAARAATMLAAVGLLEAEETHQEEGELAGKGRWSWGWGVKEDGGKLGSRFEEGEKREMEGKRAENSVSGLLHI